MLLRGAAFGVCDACFGCGAELLLAVLASVLQPLAAVFHLTGSPGALRTEIFILVYSVQIESTEDAEVSISSLSGLRPAAPELG